MNSDANTVSQQLYELLPAVYRLRDAEQGGPLRELIDVIAEQVAVVQEGLEQAYDDLFIETCAPWVVPYIGDLIGARPVHGKAPGVAGGRAAVADTLALRQRKGTVAALEQAARTVTAYPTVAVEFFRRLSMTEAMNHARDDGPFTINVRDELALERLRGPFNRAAHTLEVRRIGSGRGRFNIPNIGLFLYRLRSFALDGVSAARVDDFRYTFNPLGIDTPLFTNPVTEGEITHLATVENVPMPLSRVAMRRDRAAFYGPNGALTLTVDGVAVPESEVRVCNLGDALDGSGDWAHAPADHYGVDPELGRLALPTNQPAPAHVVVSYRYGFSDEIGGGAYERGQPISGDATVTVSEAAPDVQAALDAVAAGGIVEWRDSRSYPLASATPGLDVDAGAEVELRAANGQRPTLLMQGGDLVIHGGDGALITLSGLQVAGGTLRIVGTPARVTIRHCTLVPGLSRTRANDPAQPDAPSLVIEEDGVALRVEQSICGPIRSANGATVTIESSIVDAGDPARPAIYGDGAAGGILQVDRSTLIGRVHTLELRHAAYTANGERRHYGSNTLFVAAADGSALPLRSERAQQGCVRFSVVPDGSRTPRRYRCVSVMPHFTSRRFGTPGYCQLSSQCDERIRHGAEDESEIGVFHDLYHPQRESDLYTRLDEFLRFGMEVGVFYAS